MRKMRHHLLLSVAGSLLLAGCSANWHTSYRNKKVHVPSIVTTDAKQRAVLVGGAIASTPASASGAGASTGTTITPRFCAEPSPDVYSVIASALSAGASVSKSADPGSLEAMLNFAHSSAEQGSTIPRTQTINMLRELMYRTCERFLNGGISADELPIQAVRDQRLMVSILAIEQLTGAVTPKPVVIGATAQAAQATGEAVVRLDDARKELDAASDAATKAQDKYAGVNRDGKVCDAIAKAVKDGTALTDAQKQNQTACNEAGTNLSAAQTRESRARQHHGDLQRLGAGVGGQTSTAVSSTADGGIARAHTASIKEVSAVVEEIVSRNYTDSTEVMLFCIRTLGDVPIQVEKQTITQPQADSLVETCLTFLKSKVNAATAQVMEISESRRVRAKVGGELFDQAWPTIEGKLAYTQARSKFVSDLASRLLRSEADKARCFEKAASEDAARNCFLALPAGLQVELATGE